MNGLLLKNAKDVMKIKDFGDFFRRVRKRAKQEGIGYEEGLMDIYIVHKSNFLKTSIGIKTKSEGNVPHKSKVFLNMCNYTCKRFENELGEEWTEKGDKVVSKGITLFLQDLAELRNKSQEEE